MTESLRIAVADDEVTMLDYFEDILARLGHEVVAAAATGDDLLAACRRMRPDLVITDIRMPGLDGIEVASQLSGPDPIPVILVSAYHDRELIERAEADHILAYLIKPIRMEELEVAIAIVMNRFRQFETLRLEAEGLRQALEDRKVVEKAKGLLMKQTGLDEEAAFRRLQKLASRQNLRLVEVARSILLAGQALEPD